MPDEPRAETVGSLLRTEDIVRAGRGDDGADLRRHRKFVSRHEFAALSRNAPGVDLEAFRADQDAALLP